ncbi:MAG: hypothetical protein ACO29V_04570 [Limnohabitans sp.]
MHPIERDIVAAVVTAALDAGLTVSVLAGDQDSWAIERCRDKAEIMGHLGQVDEDFIKIHDHTTGSLGWFVFIYGNEPYYVISDHSTRPACTAIMAKVQPLIAAHEAAGQEV